MKKISFKIIVASVLVVFLSSTPVFVFAADSMRDEDANKNGLIKLKSTYFQQHDVAEELRRISVQYGISLISVYPQQKNKKSPLSLWYRITQNSQGVYDALKLQLSRDKAIEIAGYDHTLKTTSVVPNDPLLEKQWALASEKNTWQNAHPAIAASEAWALETGSADIIVAILDTGVDYTHEDLRDNMWVNEIEANGMDNFDDDGNGCVDDIYGCDFRSNVSEKLGYYPGLGGAFYEKERYIHPDGMGHGTMVAGIIGAVGNNGIGISGVSWKTKIMAVKFINQNNAANMVDAAIAIQYAVDNGAKIINNSYGRQRIDDDTIQIIEDAISYANHNGVLMIASAGNSGVDIDNQNRFYPADSNANNLITVAAMNENDVLWEYSNYGYESVDIAAPGVAIWTTVPAGETSLFRKYYDPSGYLMTEGTSIATPFVTGVAALLFSRFPGITHHEVKDMILNSADILPELENKVSTSGRINIYNALTAR